MRLKDRIEGLDSLLVEYGLSRLGLKPKLCRVAHLQKYGKDVPGAQRPISGAMFHFFVN